MKIYAMKSCEDYIGRYVNEYEGKAIQIREGVLGLGTVLLYGAKGKKSIIINEIYLNGWCSGHTVRKYNKLPKKYANIIN